MGNGKIFDPTTRFTRSLRVKYGVLVQFHVFLLGTYRGDPLPLWKRPEQDAIDGGRSSQSKDCSVGPAMRLSQVRVLVLTIRRCTIRFLMQFYQCLLCTVRGKIVKWVQLNSCYSNRRVPTTYTRDVPLSWCICSARE